MKSGMNQNNTSSGADSIDRRSIRKSRKEAEKKAKRAVRTQYDEVFAARPVNSRPADQILSQAVKAYDAGPIARRDLKPAITRLEATIRRGLPDLLIIRAPRSVSSKPERVGLMVFETRAITEGNDRIITAENHAIVLEEDRLVFISGLLPGGTRPHLFERILERGGRRQTMAEVQLQLSTIWPTLLWMRAEQRSHSRGSPIPVMITPFEKGLLFGSLEKVEGLPPAGPTVAVIDRLGQQTRQLRDYYGSSDGKRLWAMTNTYVDEALLAPDQLTLRDMLKVFVQNYADVVADNDWRWRLGLGERDPAVDAVAQLFRLTVPSEERRSAALAQLEQIISSDAWVSVSAKTVQSQQRRAGRE